MTNRTVGTICRGEKSLSPMKDNPIRRDQRIDKGFDSSADTVRHLLNGHQTLD